MPVFMIGTQRSGSNLLRLMLNQLPEIAAPHPPHILQRMYPLIKDLDLSSDEQFHLLVDDVCHLVELNPVPWEAVVLDRKEIADRCSEHSLIAIYGAIYDVYAEAHGAENWCCKSLANIEYVPEIERYFKGAKYIYLYRDGRDVAVSFRKAVVGEKHFYHIAKDWADTQELALVLRDVIEPGRFFSLSYEALVQDPVKTAHDLCKFLGVPYSEAMLDYHTTGEARNAASASKLWSNVTSPLMRDNTKKFLSQASELDIRIFESVAGHVLDSLGYPRTYVNKGEELRFTSSDIQIFNLENQQLKLEIHSSVDPSDLSRRKRQESLLSSIRTRHAANY